MKRLVFVLILTLAPLSSQEHTAEVAPGAGHEEAGGQSDLAMWKWVNFAILAGIFGWAIAKHAPPFFQARIAGIQKDINEAKQVRAEADARSTAIERRLANLDAELASLRNEAKLEIESESDRILEETKRTVSRATEQAGQEIAAMAKAAENELRREAARLALELAEKKLKSRMSPELDGALVARFLAEVNVGASRN